MAGAPAGPAPAIPPLAADELSFWDLFPEDLPPARPVAYPTEDLLADHLALPDGPDSIAARLGADVAPQPAPRAEPAQAGPPTEAAWVDLDSPVAFPAPIVPEPPPVPRQPSPPEAEIVIAELLDGPAPTGLQPAGDSIWAPHPPEDDFRIDDLLTEPASGRPADPPARETPPAAEPDPDSPPAGRPRPDEQSRIAADQARRRRTRRGGGGGGGRRSRPGGG
jgi:hypothetical protein